MSNPSSNDKALKQTVNPNDDGFAIGTAGRDEDPNATTDWDVSRDNEDVMTPDDTRGLPGYPGAEKQPIETRCRQQRTGQRRSIGAERRR